MAKKQIKTTTIEEVDPEQMPVDSADQTTEIDPRVNELLDFLDEISTSANLVKIYKVVDGKKAYCGSSEPGAINEDGILQRWGGGSYYMMALFNGKFVPNGVRRIEIFTPPIDPFSQRVNSPADSQSIPGLALLQDQINRQHEMLLKMLESNKSQGMDMPAIVGMLRDMQALTPKAPDISQVLPVVMDLFTKTMDVARETAGAGDGKTDWGKLAMGAIDKLPGLISQVTMVRASAGGAATDQVQGGPAGESDMQRMIISGGIGWLKKKALAGKSVEAVADFLIDNMDDETFGPAALAILNSPFENLGKIDSEILREPLRTWFKRLYDELQGAIHAENTVDGGQGGSDTDIK